MKVAHVIQDLNLGGAESFVIDLAREQQRCGDDVEIIVAGQRPKIRPGIELAIKEIHRRRGPDVAAIIRLRSLLNASNPEVVHLHTAPGLVYGILATRLQSRRPVVFTEHASTSPDALYGRRKGVLDLLARQADAVVTFDSSLVDHLVKSSEIRRSRITVIANGIPIALESERNDTEIDHSTGDPFVVLGIGGLRPQKNYELFIEVASRVTAIRDGSTDIPVEFRIAGDGSERPRLESAIASKGVDNVRLLGSVTDARNLLRTADLLLNTSTWEGMPISMLEAMAQGVPIVATPTGSVEAMVGPAGLICEPDAASLAAAVTRLLGDPRWRNLLGQMARKRATDLFDIRLVAEKHRELYESLLTP